MDAITQILRGTKTFRGGGYSSQEEVESVFRDKRKFLRFRWIGAYACDTKLVEWRLCEVVNESRLRLRLKLVDSVRCHENTAG